MISTYEGTLECSSSSFQRLSFMVSKDVKKCLSALHGSNNSLRACQQRQVVLVVLGKRHSAATSRGRPVFLWSIASSHVLDTLQRQPEKKSPFLGLRRVQLPATGEAWCRDDLQRHPPPRGVLQLHLGKKMLHSAGLQAQAGRPSKK